MLKVENYEVMGWEHVIRGMRNPLNSWEQSDSYFWATGSGLNKSWGIDETVQDRVDGISVHIGDKDSKLMMSLRKAGTDHRKFMRMITVYLDITAPLYWWKEFDTYKVGTVANSCSTMHKIHDKEFTFDDFSHEHLIDWTDDPKDWCYDETREETYDPTTVLEHIIEMLNTYRAKYITTKTKPMKEEAKRSELMKKYWWQMIQMLPSSYNQKRTVMLNYEVLANIYKSRKNHKLDEWHVFCDWIKKLPYSELIIGEPETITVPAKPVE